MEPVDREPRMTGAATALLIAMPFALVLAWSQSSNEPSRAELAAAVAKATGKKVAASDIESVQCTVQSVTYDCRWLQRDGDVWQQQAGHLSTGADGWRLAKD